jgi:hypothetical protein
MRPGQLIPTARSAPLTEARVLTDDGTREPASPAEGLWVVTLDDCGAMNPVLFWAPAGEVDVCEVWQHAACAGALHRRVLFNWLTHPSWQIDLSNDSVRLSFAAVGITLTLPGLTAWVLNPAVVTGLRNHVRP